LWTRDYRRAAAHPRAAHARGHRERGRREDERPHEQHQADRAETRDGLARREADNRKPGADGKLPAVGNTVAVANATWTNTIGAVELITVWKDPSFDAALRAVYYARIIEIPTPRWTAYDANRFGVEAPAGVPMTTQERAFTSPIWYSP
jgi:hypothetical protein